MAQLSYRRHRFPPSIIQQAVWLYLRFTLSYRDVEDLLAERGLDISYETVRRWVLKFGPLIARKLRQRRPRPSNRWHLARGTDFSRRDPTGDVAHRLAGRRADPPSPRGSVAQFTALFVNAIILWNTIYMDAALDQLRAEGFDVRDGDVARLSPLTSTSTCSGVRPSPCPSRWPVVSCDDDA